LSSDCDYLFYGDLDTIPPDDALQTLLCANKSIITGLSTSRFDENVLAVWKGKDDKKKFLKTPEEIIEIDGAGLYCSLIKREVLEKIKFDWSSIVDDAEFFMRARASLGYKVYLHKGVLCKHYYEKNYYYFPKI